jgi:hypothetical protein
VGAGLDRAKSLIGHDRTVLTILAKTTHPETGEPEFYILNQHIFLINESRLIKRQILKDHERFKFDAFSLENYEVTDLLPWLADQKIPCELVSATQTWQNATFPKLHLIAKEGRLHVPKDCKAMFSEMSTFTYKQAPGGKYTFGHLSKKYHDDTVYSANLAVYSLRDHVLHAYQLGNFQCTQKGRFRSQCFLMGGEQELLCRTRCEAYHEVQDMRREFIKFKPEFEGDVLEFFDNFVEIKGSRISQGI